MPFTPFHMGPAMLLKAAVPRHFSLLVFGVSQILIDLEPLVRILRGDAELHGFTHTIAGATLIAAVATPVGRAFANPVLRAARTSDETASTALFAGDVTWGVALLSAFAGTFSHLLLDGIMHADMSPFAPLVASNPLLGWLSLGLLHLVCLVSGVVGAAAILIRAAVEEWRARARPA